MFSRTTSHLNRNASLKVESLERRELLTADVLQVAVDDGRQIGPQVELDTNQASCTWLGEVTISGPSWALGNSGSRPSSLPADVKVSQNPAGPVGQIDQLFAQSRLAGPKLTHQIEPSQVGTTHPI